jgi:outer membrane protein assembly factor BamE (lipoprotein component of BamABCDE complex)
MPRIILFLALGVSLMGAVACTPTSSYQGYQAIDAKPDEVKVGTDTRATVLARLGDPTATASFDKNTWYYLAQVTSKTAFYTPRVVHRDVVAISFDKDTQAVKRVDVYTLKDGRVIAMNDKETPTRGREMTVLEQMFGSLSTIGALPPDDNYTPGSHPGQP